jgi:hypothetical protein
MKFELIIAYLLKNFGIIERSQTQFNLPVIVVMDADERMYRICGYICTAFGGTPRPLRSHPSRRGEF